MKWCDNEFGWGPIVEGTHSLTLCFCASIFELPPPILFFIFGIPGLITTLRKPNVKPAWSYTFIAKLTMSIIAFFISILLAIYGKPISRANTCAQSFTALGWLLSIILLISGYYRAEPQQVRLRLWWLGQFIGAVVVFGNHTALHPSAFVHSMRGFSLFCVLVLAVLSMYPEDQPRYEEVAWWVPSMHNDDSNNNNGNRGGSGGGGGSGGVVNNGSPVGGAHILHVGRSSPRLSGVGTPISSSTTSSRTSSYVTSPVLSWGDIGRNISRIGEDGNTASPSSSHANNSSIPNITSPLLGDIRRPSSVPYNQSNNPNNNLSYSPSSAATIPVHYSELSPKQQGHYNVSSSLPTNPHFLTSQLSQHTLYGAQTSDYRAAIIAFDQALHGLHKHDNDTDDNDTDDNDNENI